MKETTTGRGLGRGGRASPPRSPGDGAAARTASRGRLRETISLDEFRRLHPRLEAFLSERFPGLSPESREEVVNDAFLALHRARRRPSWSGGSEREVFAYLRRAATSLAIDRRRRARNPVRSAEPLDPRGLLLAQIRADGPSSHEQVEAALSDREIEELARSLTDQEAGVIKRSVMWGWVPREVMVDLRVTRKRYELVRARALMKVARRLEETGNELWQRGKARLIAALVAGTATSSQVKQARALAKQSSEFRLALAKYEATVHSVTVAIPAGVALRDAHRAALAERALAVVDRGREAVAGALGRGGSAPVDAAASPPLGSATARGASAAGGGLLAKLGGSGLGAKLIAACLTGAAAAGGCLAAGVVPGVSLSHRGGSSTSASTAPDRTPRREALPVAAPNPGPRPAETSPDSTPPAPSPPPAQTTTPEPPPTTTTTTTSAAPPPVATEFGVEPSASASSTSSSSSPAGSGTGGGGSVTQREFGP